MELTAVRPQRFLLVTRPWELSDAERPTCGRDLAEPLVGAKPSLIHECLGYLDPKSNYAKIPVWSQLLLHCWGSRTGRQGKDLIFDGDGCLNWPMHLFGLILLLRLGARKHTPEA